MNYASYALYLALFGIVLAYPLGKLSQLWLFVKLRRNKTVIAEYDIPDRLTPAELGYLVDRKFADNELLATILLLCQKGFLKLVKGKRNDPIVKFTGKADGRKNLTYPEFAVLGWIETESNSDATLSELNNLLSSQTGIEESFKNETFLQLAEGGFLKKYSYFSMTENSRTKAYILSLVFCIVGAAYFLLTLHTDSSLVGGFRIAEDNITRFAILAVAAFTWPVLFVYFRLLQLIFNSSRGMHIKETQLLRDKWPEIAGYKLFLQTVEFSRMNADPNIKDPVLPYCVALGYNPDIDSLVG